MSIIVMCRDGKSVIPINARVSRAVSLIDRWMIVYGESDIFDSADPDQFHLKPHHASSFDHVEVGRSPYEPLTQRRDWIL